MRSVSGVGRVAALGAVIAAVALVAIVLFGSGGNSYEVTATFANGGQLVKGNPVQIGGVPVGSVESISITDNGQADVKMKVDDEHKPLRVGTHATIRQFSQSGIANRYVDLKIPPNGSAAIDDGGKIGADQTTTAVDLDELFNTLDPATRKSLQGFFKNQARQFHARGEQANVGFQYLNPALATSSRLFSELTRDTPVLERFLVDSSRLVTTIADRRDDLAGLIGNLNTTTRALGDQKAALAESIERLPPFMRRANTTFVNLRAALNDVDPLVDASKPVARKLGPFLDQARALAHDAGPTVRDLSVAIRHSGRNNDLIDFLHTVPPLADIAVETKRRSYAPGGHNVSVGTTKGAFQESAKALPEGATEFSFARPYSTDFLGWLDDFSTTGGGFDALGAMGRGFISLAENVGVTNGNGPPVVEGGPPRQHQYKRCPGSAEAPASDGSNVLSQEEQDRLQCKDSDRSVGNVP
ncbi:MAG TPA: MlaD family protein [Thermoleophilaceae bacterium]|jgi:phospholipid/cholesterol/gamma-HCH transport system substrate-binding protein